MCGHALGYAQSFQSSAAKRGRLVAPQADVVCGAGPGAKWSRDVKALHERIERAFIALGDSPPINDICVIGYSQGATRAEALAREFPESYSRLISIGAPGVATPSGLTHLRAALMMAGERDRQDLMKEGARRLVGAKIRAEFRIIPEATHGSMGPHPEQTMREALDWVYAAPAERP
jgi:pimeloyl-ACP methyl ester carboxylesterase